jgi:hypothetical protein
MLCFLVFLLVLKLVQIILWIFVCTILSVMYVVSILLFLCFGSIIVCTIFQKMHLIANYFKGMHLRLILCHCVQNCGCRFILFTLSSPIYDACLVQSSLNLELAHIFLSSSHHLAFSGWPVLYFKWLCIYMIYQCWWYHTVIHLVDDLYYTSNDSAVCIYMIYQCWWYHTVFHLYLGFA